jgi:hypothetical protein
MSKSAQTRYQKHFNHGLALAAKAAWAEAAEAFGAANSTTPHADAIANVAFCFRRLGDDLEAERHYRKALTLDPGHVGASVNLGSLLYDQGALDQAEALLMQAVRAAPNDGGALINLANVRNAQGRLDEAEALLRHCMQIHPELGETRRNLAHISLLKGDLAEGFRDYEWRLKFGDVKFAVDPSALKKPLWTGQPLAGKTLLMVTEQGLGDTLNFLRYGALVKRAGARALLTCHAHMTRLLEDCPVLDGLVRDGEKLLDYDFHVPLLSLPYRFGTTAETVPLEIPYIRMQPQWRDNWAALLGPRPQGARIGLVWAGSSTHKNDHNRSLPITRLEPLLAAASQAGAQMISLQVGGRPGDETFMAAHPEFRTLPPFGDWADTAAVVSQLDLVICVDTSIAHLAGALGKPVWVLLPFVPDWRWQMNRPDSPWYPTMRLFRQSRVGYWDDVLDTLAAGILKLKRAG